MRNLKLLFALISIYFSAFSQAPTISSFSPANGPVGTLVTIRGTNLSSPTAFTIGGVSAILVSGSSDSVVGMVMPGAVAGSITVTTAGGTATCNNNFSVTPTPYPVTQQGSKLVGTGAVNGSIGAEQGQSVSLSADGNTAIVGGLGDNNFVGASWVYTRSGTDWTQQGSKLVGTGATSNSQQGWSVSLSADGNTAIIGGVGENNYAGAAWVYFRSGSNWAQQGSMLVDTGAVGAAWQGYSVSLSADGNTAIVGGPHDNSGAGAVWVYTRSGSTWTQQGPKLVGTGAINGAGQGVSVSLSADGNTALVGGDNDNGGAGAAWVYTRSGSTWTQQGGKLVGTGAINGTYGAQQGISVSLAADGNTALVGGYKDDDSTGAAWVYTRSGTTWTQQGSKLVGTGAIGFAFQTESVSLSADGNTAIEGGFNDNNGTGAAWVYTRSGTTWIQDGTKLVGTGATGVAHQGGQVSLSADGTTAIVAGGRDNNGAGAVWIYSSFPTGINELNSPSTIHLYPNPNRGSFTLQTSGSIGSDYTISDMLGHVIMQQSIRTDTETIELPDAADGVYTLAVSGQQPIRFVVVR